jgi:peptidyl-prolyl cis-trans isomerase A (cyclophilin A)
MSVPERIGAMRNSLLILSAAALVIGCSPSPEPAKAPATVEAPKGPVRAPDTFQAKFETTKGEFTVEVVRAWAPHGADRFYDLMEHRFFDGARFYRVVKKFLVQFGVSKDPKANQLWGQLKLADDPPRQSNKRGFVAFAQQGPNSRTTQVFINLADNSKMLDKSGFVPFGRVVSGMDVVEQLYAGYGDMPPRGEGPDAAKYGMMGEEYVERSFPKLDTIRSVRVTSR